MSQVTLIVYRNGVLTLREVPINDCIALFNNNLTSLPSVLQSARSRRQTDTGYILIDGDMRVILSSQRGFASSHLTDQARKSLQKSWDWIEKY